MSLCPLHPSILCARVVGEDVLNCTVALIHSFIRNAFFCGQKWLNRFVFMVMLFDVFFLLLLFLLEHNKYEKKVVTMTQSTCDSSITLAWVIHNIYQEKKTACFFVFTMPILVEKTTDKERKNRFDAQEWCQNCCWTWTH